MTMNNDHPNDAVPASTVEIPEPDLSPGHGATGTAPASILPAEPIRDRVFAAPVAATSRFRIDLSAGVWTVTKDGRFSGDYLQEAHARAAVATASAA